MELWSIIFLYLASLLNTVRLIPVGADSDIAVYGIPLHEYNTIYLAFLLLMDI